MLAGRLLAYATWTMIAGLLNVGSAGAFINMMAFPETDRQGTNVLESLGCRRYHKAAYEDSASGRHGLGTKKREFRGDAGLKAWAGWRQLRGLSLMSFRAACAGHFAFTVHRIGTQSTRASFYKSKTPDTS